MVKDNELLAVQKSLLQEIGAAKSEDFFGEIIRQGVDDVLDAPHSGRYLFEELDDRPEKTFVGSRIEERLRAALLWPKGREFFWATDLAAPRKKGAREKNDFIPVDVKTSASPFAWMFPGEAVREKQISLLVHYNDTEKTVRGLSPGAFAVGLLRVRDSLLNGGGNRDGKRTLRADKREEIVWIVKEGKIPPNYLRRALDTGSLDFAVFQDRSFSEKERFDAFLRFLGNSLPGQEEVAFPRDIFESVGISLEEAILWLPDLARERGYRILFSEKDLPEHHYVLRPS